MSETWAKSYTEKPDWWDDDTEPRCDECGIHHEDNRIAWCGECGSCDLHCTCPPEEMHPVDLDRTMRSMLAPWVLRRLADREHRASEVKAQQTTIHGMYGGNFGARMSKKGIEQLVDRGELVPIDPENPGKGNRMTERYHVHTWKEVCARVDAMPRDAIVALNEAVRAYTEHQRTYVPFRASAKAVGCGPLHLEPESEWTPAQRLYAEEHAAWAEKNEAWREEHYALDRAMRDARDACFESPEYEFVLFEVGS